MRRRLPLEPSAENVRAVYLLHQRGTEWFKIGSAKRPGKRAVDLQVGSPLPLDLVDVAWFGSEEEANCWEIVVRKTLIDFGFCEQANGEWVRFRAEHAFDYQSVRQAAEVNFGMCLGFLSVRISNIDQLRFAAGKPALA